MTPATTYTFVDSVCLADAGGSDGRLNANVKVLIVRGRLVVDDVVAGDAEHTLILTQMALAALVGASADGLAQMHGITRAVSD